MREPRPPSQPGDRSVTDGVSETVCTAHFALSVTPTHTPRDQAQKLRRHPSPSCH